jgi:site-specific DNA-cytosine methylase
MGRSKAACQVAWLSMSHTRYFSPALVLTGTRLVRRILTGVGYQTHDAMLQAAQYSVPSSRPRFILLASLPGHQLPAFPQPYNTPPQFFNMGLTNMWYIKRRAAPHRAYTVGDATTDLKLWEWENPNYYDRLPAGKNSIKQYTVKPGASFTGDNVQLYRSTPMTEFQRRMRKGALAEAYNHVTRCAMNHIARVCNIPAHPDADHMDLPDWLKTEAMRDGRYDSPRERRYRRLNINEIFLACLTTLDPMGMQMRVSKQISYQSHDN